MIKLGHYEYDYGPKYAMLARLKARAKRENVPFNLTESDLHIPEFCPILGLRLAQRIGGTQGPQENSPSFDRFYPERGYVRGNVNVISQRANRMKHCWTPEELRALLRWMDSVELLL